MKIKIHSMKTNCIFLELVLADIICFLNFFQASSLLSLAFLLTFFVLLVLVVKQSKGGKVDKALFSLVLLSVVNVVVNALFSDNAQISFDYFKKLIMFISAIFFFVIIRDAEIEEVEKKIAFVSGVVIAFLFPFAYFILNIRTMYGRYMTMGFTNPNFTAFWMLHGFLFAMVAIVRVKRIWLKVVFALIAVLILYMSSFTLNRSLWIQVIVFGVLTLFGLFRKKTTLPAALIVIVMILPIVFVFLYYSLLKNEWFINTFSFMVSEGKGLDSRTLVWDFALEKLQSGWIIGDYAGISHGTGASQMHNTHLDVLCSYGIVPLGLFIYILSCVGIEINRTSESFEQYVSLCAFLALILFGMFEASLVSGCLGLNYLTGAFLILAKPTVRENTCLN